MRGGQAALEYLNTYGWAVLVVLVVGIVLWQMGIFGSHADVNRAIGFNKIQVLELTIKYATPDPTTCAILEITEPTEMIENHLNFTIVNLESNHIHIESITMSGDCRESISSPAACENTNLSKYILAPSEKSSISHSCCSSCMSLLSDDFFWVNVSITYWQRIGERKVTHTETGVIQGFVEEKT